MAIRITFLVVGAAISMVPFFWMFSSSFKTASEMAVFPPTWLPTSPTIENYAIVLGAVGFGRQVLNSLIVAVGTVLGTLLFCSAAGFALSRMRFPGQRIIFGLILGLLMVPSESQIIPVFLIVQHIPLAGGNDILGQGGSGLLNTYFGLMMPNLATPFGIFMMRQFFLSIPKEYDESARVDGASWFTILFRIILPLSTPALAALAILSFQSSWNEFIWPLILTSRESMATMQLGLQLYAVSHSAQEQTLMAASVLNVVPIIIVFLVFQRYFVGGFNISGIKG